MLVVLAASAAGAPRRPPTASGAAVSVNQQCFAETQRIMLTGSRFTPNATATPALDGTTSSVDSDATGVFVTTLTARSLAPAHPGAQQVTIDVRDTTSGEEFTTPVSVAKAGVDHSPARARPHKRITWYIVGFVGRAVYGHWRFKSKTRADHRMGVPKGPCGGAQGQGPPDRGQPGPLRPWTLQFDFSRHYKRGDVAARPVMGERLPDVPLISALAQLLRQRGDVQVLGAGYCGVQVGRGSSTSSRR